MPKGNFEVDDETIQEEDIEVREPPMYRVLILNDDYTSMEFVVQILQQVFHKSMIVAERIMLSVHRDGRGVAGIYTKDIAETKIAIVHQLAAQHEFPLRCRMEKE